MTRGASWLVMVTMIPMPAVAQTASSATADRVVATLSRCLDIAGDSARLACTDGAARAFVDAVKRRDIVVFDRHQITKTQRSLFGLPVDAGVLLATPTAPVERIEALDTVITTAAPAGNARWTLVLAEGGRWQTIASWDGSRDPEPGMAVSIHRAALGSYILRSPGMRSVKVRRLP